MKNTRGTMTSTERKKKKTLGSQKEKQESRNSRKIRSSLIDYL